MERQDWFYREFSQSCVWSPWGCSGVYPSPPLGGPRGNIQLQCLWQPKLHIIDIVLAAFIQLPCSQLPRLPVAQAYVPRQLLWPKEQSWARLEKHTCVCTCMSVSVCMCTNMHAHEQHPCSFCSGGRGSSRVPTSGGWLWAPFPVFPTHHPTGLIRRPLTPAQRLRIQPRKWGLSFFDKS